ncbi:MAG: glycine--tRNA ligase subunit beta, partial [Pseudomonadota bacterium]
MPDLLLELFSEEIPARMQKKASADLEALFVKGFREAALPHGATRALATPRRLTLIVEGVAREAAAASEEVKGPRVGAPEQAVQGFLRKTGLALEDLEIREAKPGDPKKGQVYFAVKNTPARPAAEIIGALAPEILESFPWPKSMRWGEGSFRWVRPLRGVLCMLFDGGEGAVAPFSVGGLVAGDATFGHRVHGADRRTGAPKRITVTGVKHYQTALRRAGVIVDPEERRALIHAEAARLAAEAGLELVEDPRLLEEVTGLVEKPAPLLGRIAEEFQALPPEVLRTSMKEHQKFFAAREAASGRITGFVTVANVEAPDGGETILAGNERVLRARLSDAMFFYRNDLATGLEAMAEKLAAVTFHNQLGSQADRVYRLRALARSVAPYTGAEPDLAERAAALAKADLCSEMVYEFPELQGHMGGVYATEAGESQAVAEAIETHYAPLGPGDAAPEGAVARAVALADKLDLLAGFWAIGAKPSGSGDPFALRRAALGVIRIILEGDLRIDLDALLAEHEDRLKSALASRALDPEAGFDEAARADLAAFIAERLKVYLRDQGVRHDVVEAVYALGRRSGGAAAADLALTRRRIDALSALLGAEDGENLRAAHKRAVSILTAEEARDGVEYSLDPLERLAREPAEKALFKALDAAEAQAEAALAKEDFAAACSAMAPLRTPLDAFFDAVTVNAEEGALRRNRLCLLNRIR